MNPKEIILYDLETTNDNQDPNHSAQIVQASIMKTKGHSIAMEPTSDLFYPTVPIDYEAMAVHHITNEMVFWKPSFLWSELEKELKMHIAKDGILIAHNAAFDNTVLKNYGINPGLSICTMKLAKHIFYGHEEIKNHKLQYLRYVLKADDRIRLHTKHKITPHDARSDVWVLYGVRMELTILLAKEMTTKYQQETWVASQPSRHDLIAKQLEITRNPVLLYRMQFWKYRGERYQDIATKDKWYFERCKKSMTDIDEDTAYTINFYLDNPTQPWLPF